MVLTLRLVLLVLAVIFFILAALGIPRGNWIAIGLAFFAGSFLT